MDWLLSIFKVGGKAVIGGLGGFKAIAIAAAVGMLIGSIIGYNLKSYFVNLNKIAIYEKTIEKVNDDRKASIESAKKESKYDAEASAKHDYVYKELGRIMPKGYERSLNPDLVRVLNSARGL